MGRKLAILFWEMFKISLFVIGGGYAIIAVADSIFARRKWTEEGELVDQLPVFQMLPGLIATHTAVYVGGKLAGGLGAAVGVSAVALPSVVIFTVVSMGYQSLPLDNPWLVSAFVGLRSALTGIIAATIVRGWRKNLADGFSYAVMAAGVAAIGLFGAPVPVVLGAAMAAGVISRLAAREQDGREAGAKRLNASWLPLLLFLKYGALCFGGGFVLVPMYIQDFVGAAAPFLQISSEEFSTITATADDGYEFQYWAGDVDYADRFTNPLTLAADKPRTVKAFFAKTPDPEAAHRPHRPVEQREGRHQQQQP